MSHHGNYEDDARKGMSEMMRKAFGEFPNGKLNAQDEGALACAIGSENGTVKMMFPKPVAWIAFTPEQAVDIAKLLLEHAGYVEVTQTPDEMVRDILDGKTP